MALVAMLCWAMTRRLGEVQSVNNRVTLRRGRGKAEVELRGNGRRCEFKLRGERKEFSLVLAGAIWSRRLTRKNGRGAAEEGENGGESGLGHGLWAPAGRQLPQVGGKLCPAGAAAARRLTAAGGWRVAGEGSKAAWRSLERSAKSSGREQPGSAASETLLQPAATKSGESSGVLRRLLSGAHPRREQLARC